jgi:hypothetical protein
MAAAPGELGRVKEVVGRGPSLSRAGQVQGIGGRRRTASSIVDHVKRDFK